MNLKPAAALCLPLLCVSMALSQAADTSPTLPKTGTPAPALGFNDLLHAPAGTRANWRSLRGKVVVLEFWATWCAACIEEIPALNSLQESIDPAKVQFISVGNEDRAVVTAFLKKKPIAGWLGIDTTGKVFGRYGLSSLPATLVIGPDGRVVSTTVGLDELTRDELLDLANGKPVNLTANVDFEGTARLRRQGEERVRQSDVQHGGAVGRPLRQGTPRCWAIGIRNGKLCV
jgi:thiol-disulfide isomerase/thioredoxin